MTQYELLTAAAFLGQEDQPVGPITITQPVMIGLILAFLFWTGLARIIRGVFLSLREKEFVEAAKAMGAGTRRIVFKHIMPNTVDVVIVNATLAVALAVLAETAISFLGLGVKSPDTSRSQPIATQRSGALR